MLGPDDLKVPFKQKRFYDLFFMIKNKVTRKQETYRGSLGKKDLLHDFCCLRLADKSVYKLFGTEIL